MKKSSTKKTGAMSSSAAELTKRLGPVRKVVKMYPAMGTESSKVLVLACDHKRVGTPRKSLRCGRCKGSK
jgi:hypothetical protein